MEMMSGWRRRFLSVAGCGALAVYLAASVVVLAEIRSAGLLLAYATQLGAVLILGTWAVRQLMVLRRTRAALTAANADLRGAQASLATSNSALRLTKDELKRARQQLVDGIEGLADGFALYDSDDRLVICNRRYRQLYASESHAPAPGTRFEDMLRNHVMAGRVPSAVGHEEAWVAERLAQHRDPHGLFERNICGHWYRFSDRPTSDGGTVTIFTPIDELKQREQRLRENQAILQSILDHIPVTVGITDRDRRIVLMNKRLEALYGVRLADVAGRSLAEVRPSRYNRDSAAEDHRRVIETGTPIVGREDHYAGEQGEESWITSVVPIKDESGAVQYVLRTTVEVPQLATANRGLADYRAFLVEAERLARLASWHQRLGTHDGLAWSENVIDVFGLPPDRLGSNADVLALVHPDDRERIARLLHKAVERPGLYETEYRIVRPDGTTAWIRGIAKVQQDSFGKPYRLIGTIQDITKQKFVETALRESEERLRTFMRNAPAAMAMKDTDRRFLMLNGWVESAYGRPARELIGRRAVDIFPSEGTRALDAMESEVMATGGTVTREVHFPERERLPWTYEVRFPIRDGAGAITAIGGIAIDIADRKRAELALRDSEARLRRAQQQAKLAYWHWQLDAERYQWAPGSGLILGMPDAELPGTEAAFYERLHPDDRKRMHGVYESVQAGRDSYTAEYRIVRPDGEIIWVEETGAVERDAAGRRVSVAGITQDITERKQAERALREGEARLRRAQQQARLAYWSWQFASDGTPEEYRWSPGSGPLLGVADGDMPKNDAEAREVMYADDVGRVRRLYDDVRADLDQYVVEYRVTRPDGAIAWVREIGEVVRDGDGRRVAVEGTLQDITGQRALEEQLVQSQKMEAIGHLTGGIAHDFNNLLAVILGNLELLAEELPGHAGARQKIEAALRSTLRGSDLTHRLLAYARRQPLAPKTTRVDDLIRNMRDLLLRPLGPTIAATFALDDGLWPAEIDQAQLETSLLNLVINARDAMSVGGRLVIEAANLTVGPDDGRDAASLTSGDYVRIAVSDSGVGMSEAVKARAFDPFFTTKGVGQGTGLGLSMVYGFVKQSGGHIEIDSAIGRGTTVRIFLPRARSATLSSVAALADADRTRAMGSAGMKGATDERATAAGG
ncbi:MAG: PAS domain S-box protein [Dongiaceae bacterium]